jgi:threonine synthase
VIKANESVVVISTAHGLKFADFKVSYHAPESTAEHKNLPQELKPTLAAVKDAVARFLEKQR